jgi:hypothetical protein
MPFVVKNPIKSSHTKSIVSKSKTRVINCSYDDENSLKKCKGLFSINKELNLIPADAITSDDQ